MPLQAISQRKLAPGGPGALFWALGPPGAPKGGGEASRAFLRGVAFIYVGAGPFRGLATPFVPDSAFSGISGPQTCLLPELNCVETTQNCVVATQNQGLGP